MFMLACCERNVMSRRVMSCMCLAEPPRESPPARDAMKALEKKLADGLARIDNELRESQQVAAAAAANAQVGVARLFSVARR